MNKMQITLLLALLFAAVIAYALPSADLLAKDVLAILEILKK
ncbi:hypothetical protein VB711_20185 [Cronbergia sp. UHCC 0137]|nr:hypothetical protein [Cronbergia sp. UHCC 0137]MEA5620145.1 hypothetical protein [Cronbergia sp. UHCC 0137]